MNAIQAADRVLELSGNFTKDPLLPSDWMKFATELPTLASSTAEALKESIEWIKSRPHDGSCTHECDCWKSWALAALNAKFEEKEKR